MFLGRRVSGGTERTGPQAVEVMLAYLQYNCHILCENQQFTAGNGYLC